MFRDGERVHLERVGGRWRGVASIVDDRPPAPATPTIFPSSGKWLLKILARDNRFVFGVYRRHMKVISYLGSFDRLFGFPVTTRNWNTVTAIARVVEGGGTGRAS